MVDDLQGFLGLLEADGELRRVTAAVSPLLEITEIIDRQARLPCARPSATAARFDAGRCGLGGHALLFENVVGADFPVAINVFGSYRRLELALGCERSGGLESLAARVAALTRLEPPASLRQALARARELLPLLRIAPRTQRRGVCQEVIRLAARGEVDLLRLPALRCWPLDGNPAAVGFDLSPEQAGTAAGEGRFITFAGMHTIHAEDAGKTRPRSHNVGMYRAQLIDRTHLAMHWHVHHDGAAHWRSWRARGEPMPIAICLGGEPVLPYAATAPLPPGIGELLMAGFLAGRGIPLVRAQTVPLRVPANSEIVIEGYVSTECGSAGFDPRDRAALGPGAVLEGPFGDHTGFYSLPDRYPVVEVTAVTHRRSAVFPATIVGLPPQEDYYLGKATERVFLPPLRLLVPDVEDYHLPRFGCFHNCAFVKIHKEYPLQARRVMASLWGAGQMAWTKILVVVDGDVDVHDEHAVLRVLLERTLFVRDLEIVSGPLDILDHAAPRLGAGYKLGFDATRKIPGEEVRGVPVTELPELSSLDPAALAAAAARFSGRAGIVAATAPAVGRGRLVVAAVAKESAGAGARAIQAVWDDPGDLPADLVVAIDADHDPADLERALFLLCANSDPGRDLHRAGGRIGIDATSKLPGDARNGEPVRDFPPILTMTDDIRRSVDQRWPDLFP